MSSSRPIPLPCAIRQVPSSEAPVLFTAAAAARVRELVHEDGRTALKLRVSVSGGSCSGFQYGFDFDETQEAEDTVVQRDGAMLLVDALSLPYLRGAEVDYVEDLRGAQFVIRNPNATTTCGCGTSFAA